MRLTSPLGLTKGARSDAGANCQPSVVTNRAPPAPGPVKASTRGPGIGYPKTEIPPSASHSPTTVGSDDVALATVVRAKRKRPAAGSFRYGRAVARTAPVTWSTDGVSAE